MSEKVHTWLAGLAVVVGQAIIGTIVAYWAAHPVLPPAPGPQPGHNQPVQPQPAVAPEPTAREILDWLKAKEEARTIKPKIP